MRHRPDLSVVVVNWNTRDQLQACLTSVERHLSDVDHELIVVDNDSDDGSAEMVAKSFPRARLVRNDVNVGFGRANNHAMQVARGDWYLLLNSDAALVDDSVARLLERVRREPSLGVAQCRLRFPDGSLQHSAYRFPSLSLAVLEDLGLYRLLPKRVAGRLLLGGYWDHSEERDVDWVSGAFMLIPAQVFEQTGGFDERLFMYGEDLEWCHRIRDRGWRVRYFPQATAMHRHHFSSDQLWGNERVALSLRRQRDVYRERHGALAAIALMVIRMFGAGIRAAYFSLRQILGGANAQTYARKRASSAAALRTFARLTVPGR